MPFWRILQRPEKTNYLTRCALSPKGSPPATRSRGLRPLTPPPRQAARIHAILANSAATGENKLLDPLRPQPQGLASGDPLTRATALDPAATPSSAHPCHFGEFCSDRAEKNRRIGAVPSLLESAIEGGADAPASWSALPLLPQPW